MPTSEPPDARAVARDAGLRYASDDRPGIRRRRQGRGFSYRAADGTLIGRIKVPEICSNVVFGGPKRNYLFICATASLYGVLLPVNGLKTF